MIVWRNPSNGRRYVLRISNDLFDGWVVEREWWGDPARHGGKVATGYKRDLVRSEDELERLIAAIDARRTRHGYVLVTPCTKRWSKELR